MNTETRKNCIHISICFALYYIAINEPGDNVHIMQMFMYMSTLNNHGTFISNISLNLIIRK